MTTGIFDNEAFPIEARLRAALRVLEMAQQRNAALERRKTPPERAELERLQQELARAKETIQFLHECIETWKSVALRISNEVDELKVGTLAARMERERDFWKARYFATIPTIGRLLERQGNCELLEEEISTLERQNAALRKRKEKV